MGMPPHGDMAGVNVEAGHAQKKTPNQGGQKWAGRASHKKSLRK
jgi:hypothetical protein